jgi:hypothetical protein
MDAIELLKRDHAKVTELFHRMNDGGGLAGVVRRLTGNSASPRQRRTIALRICDELDTHSAIEESAFYPAVRALRDDVLNPLPDESLTEHARINERVAAARAVMDDEGRLREAMSSLQACVDRHLREEEGELFPLVEDRMPDAERDALGRELAARKQSRRTASRSPGPASARGRSAGRARAAAGPGEKTATARRARRESVKRATAASTPARERRRVRNRGTGTKGRTGGGKPRASRR